jgi:hypothetical protein
MFFKAKIEVLHNLKNYKAMFETQTNHQFKILKFDDGLNSLPKYLKLIVQHMGYNI